MERRKQCEGKWVFTRNKFPWHTWRGASRQSHPSTPVSKRAQGFSLGGGRRSNRLSGLDNGETITGVSLGVSFPRQTPVLVLERTGTDARFPYEVRQLSLIHIS